MEHSQSFIIRYNETLHTAPTRSRESYDYSAKLTQHHSSQENQALFHSSRSNYNSLQSIKQSYTQPRNPNNYTIRFQVIVWNIGALNVIEGRVPVTFRLTLFWNDTSCTPYSRAGDDSSKSSSTGSYPSTKTSTTFEMKGRHAAIPRQVSAEELASTVPIPPLSILNVVTFTTVGHPEVTLLREETGLWRWTCMYRADLIQDHWRVDDFPHDRHDICLKLGILAHRGSGQQWDRTVWKLGLATESDTQGSIRIPHGLVVDHICIPEFSLNQQGLRFDIEPLRSHGPGGAIVGGLLSEQEECLAVQLGVQRDSYYYDRNVVPLLGVLNLVAITVKFLDPSQFFQRALIILNIAFVEMNIRMTTDKHLPSVAYPIKLQRLLNEYFFGLLFLVLTSSVGYQFDSWQCDQAAIWLDVLAAVLVLSHNVWTLHSYFKNVPRCDSSAKMIPVSSDMV